MSQIKAWLAPYSWEFVTAQNFILCGQKGALHNPTSDGHDTTKAIWQANHQKAMSFSISPCHPSKPSSSAALPGKSWLVWLRQRKSRRSEGSATASHEAGRFAGH